MLKVFGIFGFVALLIGGAIWWKVYRWNDCRAVGHGWFYCVATIGK